MNLKLLLTVVFTITMFCAFAQETLDKKIYYEVLSGTNIQKIDEQLHYVKKHSGYSAHEGALLMKKAGLNANSSEKLSLFKTGRNKLEMAIKKDSNSVELRFLRLIIQENSPKIVHYDQNKIQDASYLRLHFKKLQPLVQEALIKYSEKSNNLKPADFKSIRHD